MTRDEKIRIARSLERLNVDVIEAVPLMLGMVADEYLIQIIENR